MEENLLTGLALILLLGVGAQWLAWRIRMPSILLLLLIGFTAGPVTGAITGRPLLDPHHIMGELLFPVVSVSVAVILFEGGLSLRFSELLKVGRTVINLVSAGAIVTWGVATAAAHYILGLPTDLSLLLGAILIVTGPTVIGPLLRDIRPRGSVAAVLKWEGIVIDPIGAIIAVLVMQAILLERASDTTGFILSGVLTELAIGTAIGVAGAVIIFVTLRKYWIPDFLQNPVSLMMVIAVFTISNIIKEESGLVAVTVMGMALTNQKKVDVRHIVEFKENLRVLLISSLFILLASNVKLEQLTKAGPLVILFVIVLIAVARPLSVFVSTFRSGLTINEKVFLSWMAPRGIVAAAVSSIFALKLVESGRPEAEIIVPVTFAVIVLTVMVYGLTAGPLAQRLGIRQTNPQGVMILGTDQFSISLAQVIKDAGFKIFMVDNNWFTTTAARMKGLPTFYGSILTHCAMENIDLDGIGRLLSLTSNDEVNSLASLHFSELFGRSEVYQLPPDEKESKCHEAITPLHLRGRFLFGPEMSYFHLNKAIASGWIVKATNLTEEFGYRELEKKYDGAVESLMLVNEKKELLIFTVEEKPASKPGCKLIFIADPSKEIKTENESQKGVSEI